MNDDALVSRESLVPMRASSASQGASDAKRAGTKHPTCAVTTASATLRR